MCKAELIGEHRALEAALDRMAAALREGNPVDAFRLVLPLLVAHYRHEEAFLTEAHPALGRKMVSQHADAREIASALDDAIAAGHTVDILRLARRFHAVAQHNIVEEERDLYSLVK